MDISDIDFEALRDRGLYVATPMYGGQCFGSYTLAVAKLTELCGAGGIKNKLDFVGNCSLIPLARNHLANKFLETDFEHLLFWDADVEISPVNIFKLMAFQANSPQYDIIGAAYPVKKIRWDVVTEAAMSGVKGDNLEDYSAGFPLIPVKNAAYDDGLDLSQPVEVETIATGMMMVRRSVLERYAVAYPELIYGDYDTPDKLQVAFFQGGVDASRQRYVSEDFSFCRMARDIGARVWVCPWMRLGHTGTHVYTGSVAKLSEIGAVANRF